MRHPLALLVKVFVFACCLAAALAKPPLPKRSTRRPGPRLVPPMAIPCWKAPGIPPA